MNMWKKELAIALMAFFALSATAKELQREITLENKSKTDITPYALSIDLNGMDIAVKSAKVTLGGEVVPCQLDDLDGNGSYDELFVLVDLPRKKKVTLQVALSDSGAPLSYQPRVYVDMMLTNKKIKESNKQDLYISQLTVDRGVNPYNMLHHHGAAFENELVAYRVYFDHRQTVDIYGKYKKGLELKETQFYPDKAQAAAGYGDDVLWVGNTFGVGTLRGWDGSSPTMVSDVEHRGQRIIARGPLRTLVEVYDQCWRPQPSDLPVDMTTRYTLYAGRRDCRVDVKFSRPMADILLSTGIINVKNSMEYSDHRGLRGCWGTDWPVSEKDSAGHKRETVGLGICLPAANVSRELEANSDNYPFVVSVPGTSLSYGITFGSDNESFGMHCAKDWFAYLEEWKKILEAEVVCTMK